MTKAFDFLNKAEAQMRALANEAHETLLKESYTDSEFSREVRAKIDNIYGLMSYLNQALTSYRNCNDAELVVRYRMRTRFHVVCGDFTKDPYKGAGEVGPDWLQAKHAFQERDRKQTSNDASIAAGRKGIRKRQFYVYGYTPTTGKWVKYDTLEQAQKDEYDTGEEKF